MAGRGRVQHQHQGGCRANQVCVSETSPLCGTRGRISSPGVAWDVREHSAHGRQCWAARRHRVYVQPCNVTRHWQAARGIGRHGRLCPAALRFGRVNFQLRPSLSLFPLGETIRAGRRLGSVRSHGSQNGSVSCQSESGTDGRGGGDQIFGMAWGSAPKGWGCCRQRRGVPGASRSPQLDHPRQPPNTGRTIHPMKKAQTRALDPRLFCQSPSGLPSHERKKN